ncbi:VWA domain-containing protein [Rhodobacteraceae bacterium SC52]|nr:VWA domain-containing protein [Rhodobacteraceae bacterium SC52]
MTPVLVALEAFHLLRPLWLGALVPIAALWWMVRARRAHRAAPRDGLAPHLRDALTVGSDGQRRVMPIDMVCVALALLTFGASGPTWSRQPDPFVAQSAPLVAALKVTPSMTADDIAPSRLERGKQKIRDLLELRAGARTALIAYAGTAHVAVPMTEDPGVMLPYLAGLDPAVMPEEGDRPGLALDSAQALLSRETGPGAVLFVADGLDPEDVPALSAANVIILSLLPEGQGDRGLEAVSDVPVIAVTADGADVAQIDRLLDAAQARALLDDDRQPWLDRGPWLALPAALLTLLWFRRGWTMRWVFMVAAFLLTQPASQARADGIADWFFTPDQRGRLAFDRGDFRVASEAFSDPLWRGYALYRDGQYADAAEVLSRVETAQAAFIQGMAYLRSRSYRDGVRAFETALSRDPDYPNAAENLETARAIVAYVEEAQEQSDTGEDRGIGADDVVFDNESGKGEETVISVPEDGADALLSADQWMTTVDTRTGDFLKSRFALEQNRPAPSAEADAPDGDEPREDSSQSQAPELAE